MFEVKVTIEAPELASAINNLATAIGGNAKPVVTQTAPVAQTAAPTPTPANANAPTAQPAAPVMPATMPAPTPVATNAPVSYPAPNVPLAQPPKYTVDQIMAAGATLMDAGKVNELMNLLHSFGVQAVMDLKPEQLGAFATAMRELGAQI